jgi:uncharacterized membrane protein YjgN (DUF898 family)
MDKAALDVAVPGAETRYPVEFTATTGEYFRIWIVNLALTIVTLGIYSAWAKVRKKRYFYAHTRIADEGFEYRGNPVAILKGRIVAVALLAAYSIAGQVSPVAQGVLALLFAIVFPWLYVRSLAFNAYNSAYRNIRLSFGGTYTQALALMAWCAFVTVITGGIGYPYARAKLTRFSAEQHRYGTAPFALPSLVRGFYGIFLRLVGLTILFAGAVFGLGAAVMAGAPAGSPRALLMMLMPIGMFALYLMWFSYPRARVGNLVWNNLTIGGGTSGAPQVRFENRLRARDLAWLYFVNVLALVVTLGLATAWAVVRTMRYRAEKMTLQVTGGLDGFVAGQASEVAAAPEEVGEMFGFDFSI